MKINSEPVGKKRCLVFHRHEFKIVQQLRKSQDFNLQNHELKTTTNNISFIAVGGIVCVRCDGNDDHDDDDVVHEDEDNGFVITKLSKDVLTRMIQDITLIAQTCISVHSYAGGFKQTHMTPEGQTSVSQGRLSFNRKAALK
uniref:Uncharacterized protein n=1 Tax=Glossina austeni TaxID=7395 RepID=A0A1A9UQ93_GLOAU